MNLIRVKANDPKIGIPTTAVDFRDPLQHSGYCNVGTHTKSKPKTARFIARSEIFGGTTRANHAPTVTNGSAISDNHKTSGVIPPWTATTTVRKLLATAKKASMVARITASSSGCR
jgi:hypothetical protein